MRVQCHARQEQKSEHGNSIQSKRKNSKQHTRAQEALPLPIEAFPLPFFRIKSCDGMIPNKHGNILKRKREIGQIKSMWSQFVVKILSG